MILNWHDIIHTLNFTEREAREKIGRRVRTLRAFSGIPEGTLGEVMGMYDDSGKGFWVFIRWSLPSRSHDIVDGFSKDEYLEFLAEVKS